MKINVLSIHWAKIAGLSLLFTMGLYYAQDKFDKKDVSLQDLMAFNMEEASHPEKMPPYLYLNQALTAAIAIENGAFQTAIQNYLALAKATDDRQAIQNGLQLSMVHKDYASARIFAELLLNMEPKNSQAKLLTKILAMPEPEDAVQIFMR